MLFRSAKQLLGRLIAFDTTSHKTNLPMAAFIRDYLAGFAPGIGSYVWAWDDPLPSLLHPWHRLRRGLWPPKGRSRSNSVREVKSC